MKINAILLKFLTFCHAIERYCCCQISLKGHKYLKYSNAAGLALASCRQLSYQSQIIYEKPECGDSDELKTKSLTEYSNKRLTLLNKHHLFYKE